MDVKVSYTKEAVSIPLTRISLWISVGEDNTQYVAVYTKDMNAIMELISGRTARWDIYLKFRLRGGLDAWVLWDRIMELYRVFLGKSFDWAVPHGAKSDPMNWITYYGGRSERFGRLVARRTVNRYIVGRLAKMIADNSEKSF